MHVFRLNLPQLDYVGFIEGDGIGRDITPPSLRLIDKAVAKAYGSGRKIACPETLARARSSWCCCP